jgi:26S proteasome regulatory subunit N2
MPKTEFRCNAKPSLFAYPPALEEKKKDDIEKVETAVLSITNKKKQQSKSKSSSAIAKSSSSKKSVKEDEKMEVDDDPEKKAAAASSKKSVKEEEPEPSFFNITNPSRVVRAQLKTLALPENSRYKPLKTINNGGIILLRDNKTQDPEEIVELSAAGGANGESGASTQVEAKPHTPFEFTLGTY